MKKAAPIKQERENAFTIYPDDETLAAIDHVAASQERKRAPMAVILIKAGLATIPKPKKPRP